MLRTTIVLRGPHEATRLAGATLDAYDPSHSKEQQQATETDENPDTQAKGLSGDIGDDRANEDGPERHEPEPLRRRCRRTSHGQRLSQPRPTGLPASSERRLACVLGTAIGQCAPHNFASQHEPRGYHPEGARVTRRSEPNTAKRLVGHWRL